MIYRTCIVCQKEFTIKKPCEARRPSRLCCSRGCASTRSNLNRYKDIGVSKVCVYCQKPFFAKYSRERNTKIYCSKHCALLHRNKDILPEYLSENYSGENSKNWKGESAGYFAKHIWIRLILGRANHCEICGGIFSKKYEWANISREYKRVVGDWIPLCRSCHQKLDRNNWSIEQLKQFRTQYA